MNIRPCEVPPGNRCDATTCQGGGPYSGPKLQPVEPAGELPDEVLHVPSPFLAAVLVGRRGCRGKDHWLRVGKNVPYLGGPASPPLTSLLYRDEENPQEPPHGHITSLAVMRTYRKMGIAEKLMRMSRTALVPDCRDAADPIPRGHNDRKVRRLIRDPACPKEQQCGTASLPGIPRLQVCPAARCILTRLDKPEWRRNTMPMAKTP